MRRGVAPLERLGAVRSAAQYLPGIAPGLKALPQALSPAGYLAGLLAVVFLCDLACHDWHPRTAAEPILWAGNGIWLGAALISRSSRLGWWLAGSALSTALWHVVAASPAQVLLTACIAHAVMTWLLAAALRARVGLSCDLTKPGTLPRVAGLTVGVSLVPTLVVAAHVGAPGPAMAWTMLGIVASNAIGVIVAAPLVLALHREELRELFAAGRRGVSGLALGLLALVSGIVFFTDPQLLFLTFPPLLLAVARLGFAGACVAVPVVAALMVVSDLPILPPVQQAYLATLATISFGMGMIMSGRRRLDLALIVRETSARFAEAKMRQSEERFRRLSENSADIVSRIDLMGRRLYISKSIERILGWTPQDVDGLKWVQFLHPEDRDVFQLAFGRTRPAEEQIVATYRCARKDGSWAWIEARMSLVRDSRGEPLEYISNARDVSHQKETEQALAIAMSELSVLATTDGLTGIANRRRFDETLRREWRRAMRAGRPIALLMIDVDFFKSFNDRYGHQDGDTCLRRVAACLRGSLHRPGDLAARYGGEEFALILPETDLVGAQEIAARVLAEIMALQILHSASECGVVTVSIGCAAAVPTRHSTVAPLILAADTALYASKIGGRNRFSSREPELGALPIDVGEMDEESAAQAEPETAECVIRHLRTAN